MALCYFTDAAAARVQADQLKNAILAKWRQHPAANTQILVELLRELDSNPPAVPEALGCAYQLWQSPAIGPLPAPDPLRRVFQHRAGDVRLSPLLTQSGRVTLACQPLDS